ncbi:sensor histidine kinase [Halobellus sp. Atlit-31R]|nr:sensor histidine kinase [Halobellus sp. Atlit-31R]
MIAKLTERNRQLEVIDRVLRHNFHNKINVIKGYAKMAAREAEDGVAAYVETIDDAVDRLVELVDKEHEITQILSDPPAVEAFDVVPVVESAAATVAAKYPEATIETDLPETCSVVASVEIGQAIAELIENGVVYSESTDPTVVVAVATEGEMVRVSVSDEGKSIPEVEQRVHTGDADITQLSHGLGLGLRLVSLLAEQSGGELEFETNEPQGSTVTLEFATPSETAEEGCR